MSAPTLAAAIERSAAAGTTIEFAGRSGRTYPLGELWDAAADAVERTISQRAHRAVAAVMGTNPQSVVAILAAIQAGVPFVSLPQRTAGSSAEEWNDRTHELCLQLDADRLDIGSGDLSLELVNAPGAHSQVRTHPQTLDDSAVLVQFTSGTSGCAEPVVLTDHHLMTNVAAIHERLDIGPGDSACSWLPLSHDMGLIGMLFATILAGDARCGGEPPSLALLEPRRFVARPSLWPQLCAERQATITAGPDFALRMLRESQGRCEWGPVRALLVGAELVRTDTLQSAEELGLLPQNLRPAYGMAEATLAVSIGTAEAPTVATPIEGNDPFSETAFVSCGPPLPGVEVAIDAPDGAVGRVSVRGETIATTHSDEWFVTNDLAFSLDGEVFPVGRCDDIVVVRGRNIDARLIDAALGGVAGVRARRLITVVDHHGNLAIACELLAGHEPHRVADELRIEASRAAGVTPAVYVAPHATLPITSSGKLGRAATAAMIRSEGLEPVS